MESLFCPVHFISSLLYWPDVRWTDDESVLIRLNYMQKLYKKLQNSDICSYFKQLFEKGKIWYIPFELLNGEFPSKLLEYNLNFINVTSEQFTHYFVPHI